MCDHDRFVVMGMALCLCPLFLKSLFSSFFWFCFVYLVVKLHIVVSSPLCKTLDFLHSRTIIIVSNLADDGCVVDIVLLRSGIRLYGVKRCGPSTWPWGAPMFFTRVEEV